MICSEDTLLQYEQFVDLTEKLVLSVGRVIS
jgi:hypothetical protein